MEIILLGILLAVIINGVLLYNIYTGQFIRLNHISDLLENADYKQGRIIDKLQQIIEK